MDVRPATADDVGEIRETAAAAWHAAHDPIVGADTVEDLLADWYDPADLREQVAREEGHFLIADDGGVVGFAHAGPSDDDWGDAVLSRLYVEPDTWGEGVGSTLLDETERRLRQDGHERLWLAVMADNDVGRPFYESRGFELVTERTVELAGSEIEDVVMARDL
jgi:GNAT superfamily N-acetyltransferase